MRIPEIQTRLKQIAVETGNAEIELLARKLSRRRPRKVAEKVSRPITPELREEIRAYARENPELAQTQIGKAFNINQGRVSEALRGYRR